MLSTTFWSAGPPIEVRFAVVTVSAIISAVFQGQGSGVFRECPLLS